MTETRIILLGDVDNYLEISENVIVPINFSISDIRNVSSKSGSFSKSIKVVGTKHNNEVLNNLFDVNTVTLTYNINKKQECIIVQNGDTILDNAILQLVDVEKTSNGMNDDEQVIYTVTIKDTVGDLFTSIGNAMLTDLDFSDLNHLYTSTNIVSSWSNNVTDGYKYILPMSSDNTYQLIEMKPAIYLKTYLDRIFSNAGYQYEFDEITSTGFDKLLMPYNGGKITLSKSYLEEVKTTADNNTPTTYSLGDQIIIDNEIVDPFGAYNPATSVYTSPFAFNIPNALESRFTIDYEILLENPNGADLNCIGFGNYVPQIKIDSTSFDTNINIDSIAFAYGDTLPSGVNTIGTGNKTISGFTTLLSIGDTITYLLNIISGGQPNWDYSGGLSPVVLTLQINSISVDILPSADSMAYSFPVIMNQYVPVQIKQSDFIKSIFTMFNLYCQPDSTDINKIILKTRDTFYDEGIIKDWSKKLNKDKSHTLTFLPDVTSKTLTLTYAEDKDELNVGYLQNVAEVYGQIKYVFDNEYIKNDDKKSLIFGASPFVDTSFGAVVTGLNGSEPKTLPRIVYDGGNYPCGTFYIYDYGTTGETCTTYPLTTHFDKPINPDLDFNFGICDYYFSQSYQNTTLNNLSTLYWRRTMSQINSGKLYTVYLDLNSSDIAKLKLNDKIYLDRSYWNINKIIDYNANSNEPTKVELLSIDEETTLPRIVTRKPNDISSATSTVKGSVSKMISGINHSLTLNNSSGDVTLVGKLNYISQDVKSAVVIGNGQVVTNDGITSTILTGNNFANTDLTLDNNRFHDVNGNILLIGNDPLISDSGLFVAPTLSGFTYKSGLTTNSIEVSDSTLDIFAGNGNEITITSIAEIRLNSSILFLENLPTYANEAAAILAGLSSDTIYKTATGELRIKL